MAEKQFKLGTIQGTWAVIAIIVVVLIRLLTLGESDDEGLHAFVKARLLSDAGAKLNRNLENLDINNPAEVERIIEMADEESIEVHSVKISGPLLSFDSSQDIILHVEYNLYEEDVRSEYWRVRKGLIGSWRYYGRSSAVSYYLNLL